MFRRHSEHTGRHPALDASSQLAGLKATFRVGGAVYSSAAAAGGILFVGSTNGNLRAVDLERGAEKWRFATEGRPENDRQLPPEWVSTPRAPRPVQ